MAKAKKRYSFYKTCTWRVVASLDTFLLSWLITGNITENSITRSASTMGAIAVHYDTKNLFSTVDYKQFSKKELLDYVQKQVTDRNLEAMVDIISQELSPEKKTVTEFSWNK